jgi:hypothetical protein
LIARAERSTFLNSELKWLAAVNGQDCDDSDGHNNCVVLALDEYKMKWQFVFCAGFPWNFAWVNMPLNPAHRMAIQVQSLHSARDLLRVVPVFTPAPRRSPQSRKTICCTITRAARATGFIGPGFFCFHV